MAADIVTRVVRSLQDIDVSAWDALIDGADNPFVEHAFLSLLEESGSLGEAWRPRFVVAERGGALVGATPAYLRSDSYGEFIFDWQFAKAAERFGVRYYPKLTVAVPFTPATGPRLWRAKDDDEALPALLAGLARLERDERCSSTHVLFCDDGTGALIAGSTHGYVRRASLQFHWHNDGYATFDDFLSRLDHSARKQIKRERRRVVEAGLTVEVRQAHEVPTSWWPRLYALYAGIYDRKWGRPYLTPAFFDGIARALPERGLVAVARDRSRPADDDVVAMTLSFEKGKHCYGRHWGTDVDVPGLHFELCYYALIERAIARGQTLVEAGAQGEHKLKRGYLPTITHSVHRFANDAFGGVVARFFRDEAVAVNDERAALMEHSPFRATSTPTAG